MLEEVGEGGKIDLANILILYYSQVLALVTRTATVPCVPPSAASGDIARRTPTMVGKRFF